MAAGEAGRIEVDIARLWRDLEASARIGLRRLALSDEDKAMRDSFVKWCKRAGCQMCIDAVGNIFARRPGLDDGLPAALMGSHLDTQIAGGRYDGILGVLAGLEIIRTLNDHGVTTRRSIEVVSWTNNEGVRFRPPMLGSGAFAGVFDVAWVHARRDRGGATFGAELKRIGYLGAARPEPRLYDSYFELHIEQGDVLDAEGLHVGIVTRGFDDVAFDARLINLVRSVAADLGVSHRHLQSAAGHDACNISKVVPTVMIFTPCRDGISHNGREYIEPGYTAPGVNVLLHAVLRRADA